MLAVFCFFFFKQKTAYEIRSSDWSSDVCSSDLPAGRPCRHRPALALPRSTQRGELSCAAVGRLRSFRSLRRMPPVSPRPPISWMKCPDAPGTAGPPFGPPSRGGSDMQLSSSFVPSALAFALAAASTPAGAQSAHADLYIDVPTHTMPGLGGLGTL